jgi:hypothetical protein
LLNKCIDSSISSSKISNKPPKKPQHAANDSNKNDPSKRSILTKTPLTNESESDNYIHLNQMLERFRYSKPLSKDERPKLSKSNFWWAKQSIENGQDSPMAHEAVDNQSIELNPKRVVRKEENERDEEDDESIKEESQQIESLCKRLSKLRKELYNKSTNEADSIDNFTSQSITGLQNDDIIESTSSSLESQTPTQSLSGQISTIRGTEKKHSGFNSIRAQKKPNTDSFELRTNNLIKKR